MSKQQSSKQPSVPLGAKSLPDIIEQTPVKNKVNVLDYLRTPDRVLKKLGLEKEAALIRRQYDAYLKELPKNIEKITEWSKRAGKLSSRNIFRYLDGQPIDLAPREKEVAMEIKAWLKGKKGFDGGIAVQDRPNGWKINRNTKYSFDSSMKECDIFKLK